MPNAIISAVFIYGISVGLYQYLRVVTFLFYLHVIVEIKKNNSKKLLLELKFIRHEIYVFSSSSRGGTNSAGTVSGDPFYERTDQAPTRSANFHIFSVVFGVIGRARMQTVFTRYSLDNR